MLKSVKTVRSSSGTNVSVQVKVFVCANADVLQAGDTPLHLAVEEEDLKMVNLLLLNDAKWDIKNVVRMALGHACLYDVILDARDAGKFSTMFNMYIFSLLRRDYWAQVRLLIFHINRVP